MDRNEMTERVMLFGVAIVKLCSALPNNTIGWVLGKQLLKSGTSVGANYCEALRSSSQAHFVSIIEIAQRECAETKYWLALLRRSEVLDPSRLVELEDECDQLLRILTATSRTAKQRLN
jgi:four helix bundle protein